MCNYAGRSLLSAFGLEGIPIESLLSETYGAPEVDTTLETYRGISVADYAMSSTRRFLLRHSIDFEDSYHRETYLRFLRSAVILVDMCEALFEQYPFDAVLAHDDRYVHGGIHLAVAQKHGVTSYSHALGRREGTILFGNAGNRSSLPFFTDYDTLQTELAEPLSASEERRVEDIMTARTEGSDVRINYSARTNNSFDSSADCTVGIFTNLIWDASLEVEELVFPDVLDWIDDTVEHVSSVDGVQFVLKTHPAETKFGTDESVEGRIRDGHDPLPDNLEILSPNTDVDTYALIRDLDAGIVYNSTVGLEMAYEGVPTIVAGDTHYRDLGFTFDPETQDEYFRLLGNIRDLEMDEEMIARAKRYVHVYFEQKHVDFPFFKTQSAGDNEYFKVEHDEVKPGNENFDFIVRKILADEPVLR
ncbi:hypothetical protein [Haloarcula sp. CBA1131]|uniref:hypothetical protein n=1 Tax=Haloarcula sp. CBA1131 TaxID=1853686 RepID=UPI0012441E38|nr:hypothetical protein [Haloarcula sp. CBA1131]